MTSFITLLILGVTGFVITRLLYYFLVEAPRGHNKDEAICDTCWGKKISDDVTESLEWCDCPQRKTSDEHK